MLEVENLTKRFGAAFALQEIHLEVREGEVLGLIGPNGSGKTSLFTCLAGLLSWDSGTFQWKGHSARLHAIQEHLFFLPDGISPWPDQTVEEVLQFARGCFRAPVGRLEKLVQPLDLASLGSRPLGRLSKGQRKRVLLAFALLSPQPLLLLDEPFDGLDLMQTREVMALLRRQAAQGRTLFLSIHQLLDAERVCDRLVLLSAGRVTGEGTLDELKAVTGKPNLEEVFLALA